MLCRNNWLDYSWQGHIPRIHKENLTLNFKEKADNILPFDQCCDQTAHEIADTYKNLYIALSGGADSECVADCFFRNNIPFIPVIHIFKNIKFNSEVEYALKWCRKNKIEPLIVPFDNDLFFNGGYTDLILKIRSRMPPALATVPLLKIIEDLGGLLVSGMQVEYYPDEQFGVGEGIPENYQGFLINESDFYYEVISPNRHPWAFFYWSPDMLASTIYNWDTKLCMTDSKANLYQTLWRPKIPAKEFMRQMPMALRKSGSYFGTIDCALLGDKEEILSKLVK
jgi:hypothetical protein